MIRRITAVTTLALLAVAGAAGAQGQQGRGTAAADDELAVTLDLSAYGPAVLTPDDALHATAMVSNPTPAVLTDLTVTLAVTKNPIGSSAALKRFLDDPGSATTQVADTEPASASGLSVSGSDTSLPPGATVGVSLAAAADALGMPDDTAGVYGVVVSVVGPAGVLATHTAAVTWYDAEIAPLRMAFIATASGSAERVAQVTSAASVTGAAIAIDPVTSTDAAQATALAAGRELFGLPSGDPDLTSLAHADDTTLLPFALADAATNAPVGLKGLPWLATLPVADAPTVKLAASRGATAGLLDVTGGATLSAPGPVVDLTAGGATLPVLVPHRALSEILATYGPGTPDAAARLVAESALVAREGDGVTPVVVAPGSAWQLTGPGVSASVAALLGAPWVVPVSVQSVISGSARHEARAPRSSGTDGDLDPDLIKALQRQFDDVTQLAQTAADPTTVSLPGGRGLLAPLAVALRSDPDTRLATFQATQESTRSLLTSLFVAEGSDVNLIAASGNVPVTLHNDLPVDATVTVVMKSSSPNLVVEERPVVTIPAGGDVTARIPVTGVKSANVTATVALENAHGDIVAAPQTMRVRVRADWGNAVTAIFTAGIVLLLIAGLVRTIRRGRRASRMAPMDPIAPPRPQGPRSLAPRPGDGENGGGDG